MALSLRAAWRALFSGESTASQSAQGLLSGILTGTQAPRRGTRELLQAYKRLPWLHTILRRVAEDTAAVPWEVYAPARRRGVKVLRHLQGIPASAPARATLLAKAVKAGELRALETHPFLEVLARMNPALGGYDSWVVHQVYTDVAGQAPLVRQNNALGQAVELWPVPPHWIAELPRPGAPFYRASWGAWQRMIPENELVWGRVPDPENPYDRGTSYGDAMADELDVGELRARYLKGFFHNEARPAGILQVDGVSTAEQHLRMKEDLNANHRGPGKTNRIFIHTGKGMQWQPIANTLQEMQTAELSGQDRDFAMQVLQFPVELMGMREGTNRATIGTAEYLYARGALVPRKERQRALMQPLLSEYDPNLLLGFASPVPDDEDFQARHMVSVPGAFTLNEHRAVGGVPALPGPEGEALFTPPAAPSPFGALGLSVGRPDPAWARPLARAVTKDAQAALEALRPELLTGEVGPVEQEGFERWAQEAMDALGVGGRFDMRNPLVRQRLEAFAGERIRRINETTRNELREQLAASAANGEGVAGAAWRVEQVFEEAQGYRAEMIARTELVGLSNAANVEAWRQSGVVDGKEWLSVRDGNTRDSHRELDGQTVDSVDGVFRTSTGRTALQPGAFGVAEEDINCRCTALPRVSEAKAAALHSAGRLDLRTAAHMSGLMLDDEAKALEWKRFDRRLTTWEADMTKALQRGFAKQKAAVLAALER